MSTYKVSLVFKTAPSTYTSRSRYVQASSRDEAIEAARLALRLPVGAEAVRIEIT